jgi:hypothetical protein
LLRRTERVVIGELLGELGVDAVLDGLAVVDREVDSDPQEPGDERYPAVFVTADRLERLEEGLGGEVFGEADVAG